MRKAFIYQINAYLKENNKYKSGEGKIIFSDIEECLVIVISSFSPSGVISYDFPNIWAIGNKFIDCAITKFLRQQLKIYFKENKAEAEKIAEQVLINKRSREHG